MTEAVAPDAGALRARIVAHLARRRRWKPAEIGSWLALAAAIVAFPARDPLIAEALVAGLFALSLDLILGLAGVLSLGQAAFLGTGAYAAGLLATAGYADPILGLVAGAAAAGLLGLVTAPLVLRGADLTRLMVTMGVSLTLGELANRFDWLTGGADGLQFSMGPLFGLFPIGFTGPRAAALYVLGVLFALFAFARRLRQSPFGLSIEALRENRLRADSLGVAPARRLIAIYGLSAAYAGAAGALLAQTTEIASLDLFAFHRSADAMLTLVLGGVGWLYGGMIGAAIFVVLRDVVSAATPAYWEFWIGLLLVAITLTGRERVAAAARRLVGMRAQ